jgi:hypothetical protein
VTLRLHSLHKPESFCTITAFILPRLTAKLPSFNVRRCLWPHIKRLQLADPDLLCSGPIDILIGADYYGNIILKGLIKGNEYQPIAQKTIFGWIVSGPVSEHEFSNSAFQYHCSKDNELQEMLTRFWTQEELPLKKNLLNADEADCEHHFLTTHTRDKSGRFVVRLPFKTNPDALGDSKTNALHSFWRLSKRLSTDAKYRKRYEDFLSEYLSLGHMRLDTNKDETVSNFYLPHHGVLREQSTTTKLRVVFNGSSRTSSGISLNEILHAGAKLHTDIADVLLWIRSHQFIFFTDIVKMFRQIAVHPDDWKYQKILWLSSLHQPVSYNLTTVTYGLTCAPFLALRCLQQLIEDEGSRFPKAVTPMSKGRYVDDIFGGADSIFEARVIALQVSQLCKAGGFPLQKWHSNHPELLPPELLLDCATTSSVEFEPSLLKILGLVWKPESDSFHFYEQQQCTDKISKRIILSEIARIFDPLGLISPVIIRAKILLQELWLIKIGMKNFLLSSVKNGSPFVTIYKNFKN